MQAPEVRVRDHLAVLYGSSTAAQIWPRFQNLIDTFRTNHPALSQRQTRLRARDAVLITYGDQFQQPGEPPLATLADFLEAHLAGTINAVHILPFFPYSSDDGFSVIDYRQVDPTLGSWEHIDRLAGNFRLMFDAVINHVSRHSAWFQGYLRRAEPYQDYFITVPPGADLSKVIRPRALPLLTAVETAEGEQLVWTTFSDDQIDLNYANPQVLYEICDLLLAYVAHGAEIIRLDAIAYLWKETGTTCIHLPQTHHVVKLMRALLDAVAPGVILITETNVPHAENISYFGEPLPGGKRGDEAQLVYQFPLAPLVLHTFATGEATLLTRWAASLETPLPETTFFNFIASHDGIGVRPAEGLLQPAEIQNLVDRTLAHGGKVSYKTNADGSQSAYELNITLYDALNDPQHPNLKLDIARFMASQVIMLCLAGVPGIYVHSLFGSRNCQPCLEETGRARSLNREKFQRSELEAELATPESRAAQVFASYAHLLNVRAAHPAFDPQGAQQVLEIDPAVFALLRLAPEGQEQVLCLANVSAEQQSIDLDLQKFGLPATRSWTDLLSSDKISSKDGRLQLTAAPYQALWLQAETSQ